MDGHIDNIFLKRPNKLLRKKKKKQQTQRTISNYLEEKIRTSNQNRAYIKMDIGQTTRIPNGVLGGMVNGKNRS